MDLLDILGPFIIDTILNPLTSTLNPRAIWQGNVGMFARNVQHPQHPDLIKIRLKY